MSPVGVNVVWHSSINPKRNTVFGARARGSGNGPICGDAGWGERSRSRREPERRQPWSEECVFRFPAPSHTGRRSRGRRRSVPRAGRGVRDSPRPHPAWALARRGGGRVVDRWPSLATLAGRGGSPGCRQFGLRRLGAAADPAGRRRDASGPASSLTGGGGPGRRRGRGRLRADDHAGVSSTCTRTPG